jgi:ABC-type spermidine/putrescine transport system permease subunit I
MYGNIIQGFFTRSANWPVGAAMAMTMLVLTLIVVVIGLRALNPRRVMP